MQYILQTWLLSDDSWATWSYNTFYECPLLHCSKKSSKVATAVGYRDVNSNVDNLGLTAWPCECKNV